MADRQVVEGVWPGPITITRGRSRADARRWNDETPAGHLRLVRGSADFLAEATATVAEYSGGLVYSPALYPSATRVWRRAGYRPFDSLIVMERGLAARWAAPERLVEPERNPNWDRVVEIDDAAFEGFWRMSGIGLAESSAATRRGIVLTVEDGPGTVGYAIVGVDWGVAYLQRIAVMPQHSGKGIGADLLRAALNWARQEGARAVVLNVRDGADVARRLYQTHGFVDTGTRLEILGSGD